MNMAKKCLALVVVLQIAFSFSANNGVSCVGKKAMKRSHVAVQGVVYCKSCKHVGVPTLLEASALQGATVRLACNNTQKELTMDASTDKNGYFVMLVPTKKLTSYAFHRCRAFLVKSPVSSCKTPSQLNNGTTGAVLKPSQPISLGEASYVLYNVGPFAFEPTCTAPRPI